MTIFFTGTGNNSLLKYLQMLNPVKICYNLFWEVLVMNNTNQKERSFGIALVLYCYGNSVFNACRYTVYHQRVKEIT